MCWRVGPTLSAGNATESIYYAKSIAAAAAGANTVTVNVSGSVPEADIRILEYSGLDTANPLDVTVAVTGSSKTPSSGAVSTSNANDLLVGANMIAFTTAAAGAGYTARIISTPNSDLLEAEVVTATGSYTATSTQTSSGWWLMPLAAFRMANGGSFTTITPRTAALTLLQTQQFTSDAAGRPHRSQGLSPRSEVSRSAPQTGAPRGTPPYRAPPGRHSWRVIRARCVTENQQIPKNGECGSSHSVTRRPALTGLRLMG